MACCSECFGVAQTDEQQEREEVPLTAETIQARPEVDMDDIAGLDELKKELHNIITEIENHDQFTGPLLAPSKCVLLFGPPGTGKTMLAKYISKKYKLNDFIVTGADIRSKYVGEGEKNVKQLFDKAKEQEPSLIFIDEIDSVLSKRGDSGSDHDIGIKNELLIQLSNLDDSQNRVLVLGATNRPDQMDDACIRRFPKRFLVPLPDSEVRGQHIKRLLTHYNELKNSLTNDQIDKIAHLTDGYSCHDVLELCKRAAKHGPLDDVDRANVMLNKLRPITYEDFEKALKKVRPTVDRETLGKYEQWNDLYGSAASSVSETDVDLK